MTQRTQFDNELEQLKLDLVKMGDMVIENINDSFRSFLDMNADLAGMIIKKDKDVNNYEATIEKECLRIILREQPVAGDLRFITAILKMITDLERIGDHAADIAKVTIFMEKTHQVFHMEELIQITKTCQKMIRDALESFTAMDIQMAESVIKEDDEVDRLFETIKNNVAQSIREKKMDADYALYLMMVAKYLERIGDHAVNIGEWITFAITGERQYDI